MIRTLIIDDEPSAVSLLSNLLNQKCSHDIEIVATTTDPYEGKQLAARYEPDLVFLDVQMPGITGIDLARSFIDQPLHIVFVTAFDSYAIEAFRVSAFDYLLKPLDVFELIRVVEKIKTERLKNNFVQQQYHKLEKLLSQPHKENGEQIGISMADKVVFIGLNEIIYCEANGPYTHIHTKDIKYTSSKTMGEFEEQLKEQNFFRIHHSYLINLAMIKEFKKLDGIYVIMHDDTKLEVSHRKKKEFMERISAFTI